MKPAGWVVAVIAGVLAPAAERENKTDEIFQAYTAPGSPGCAVGVMRDGKTLFAKGYGMADMEQGVAISPKSVFYMGSVSKQFMALSVLLLEEQGKLALDDSIRKHVPELPEYALPVTLRHLLHHTSGVRDFLTLGWLAGYSPDHVWTERAALRMIARQHALNFEPGTDYMYSNSGYVLLAITAQRAAGERLNDWARKHVFGPLEMSASRWQHDHADPIPNRAHGYSRSMAKTWRVSDAMFDTVGGGGMYSSIEDMMRWAANFDEGKVGAKALARMAKPGALRNGVLLANGYGMGLVRGSYRGTAMVSHSGSLAGYRTHFLRLPEKRFSVVCLCNAADAVPGRLAEQVADRWLEGELGEARQVEAATGTNDVYFPKGSPQQKLSTVDASLSSALAGVWWSEELQAVYRFREEAGQLMVEVGDNTRAQVMASEDGRLRVASIPGIFELKRDAAGTVTTILLESGRVRGIELRRR